MIGFPAQNQAAQLAASQQAAQYQAQQASAKAQADAALAQACFNRGGNWDGNACDLSFVQQQQAQQQQLSTWAQLAQAFAPILAQNPDLARGVVGNIFGVAVGPGGGSMANSVPGGAPNAPAQMQSTGGSYQDWGGGGTETF